MAIQTPGSPPIMTSLESSPLEESNSYQGKSSRGIMSTRFIALVPTVILAATALALGVCFVLSGSSIIGGLVVSIALVSLMGMITFLKFLPSLLVPHMKKSISDLTEENKALQNQVQALKNPEEHLHCSLEKLSILKKELSLTEEELDIPLTSEMTTEELQQQILKLRQCVLKCKQIFFSLIEESRYIQTVITHFQENFSLYLSNTVEYTQQTLDTFNRSGLPKLSEEIDQVTSKLKDLRAQDSYTKHVLGSLSKMLIDEIQHLEEAQQLVEAPLSKIKDLLKDTKSSLSVCLQETSGLRFAFKELEQDYQSTKKDVVNAIAEFKEVLLEAKKLKQSK